MHLSQRDRNSGEQQLHSDITLQQARSLELFFSQSPKQNEWVGGRGEMLRGVTGGLQSAEEEFVPADSTRPSCAKKVPGCTKVYEGNSSSLF